MNELTKVEITKTGLVGVERLSETEFWEQGRRLSRMEKGLQWAIGDWYNSIPWGDKEAACEKAGLTYVTARDYALTARQFELSTRVDILSFKHHRMVSIDNLTNTDRYRLLKRAADAHWTSAKLRLERDIILGKAPPAPTQDFDKEVDNLESAVIDALPDDVSKTVVNKVKSGLHKLAGGLKHEYAEAVEKSASAKAKIQRDNLKKAQQKADEKFDKAVKMKTGIKAFMTKDEFVLIRGCLHPDKNRNPKSEEAFQIFNRLADVKNW